MGYRFGDLSHNRSIAIVGCIALLILTVSFYQVFMWRIMPPQIGWWQYYGWRLSEGDILYKDLYCFMPPYWVWAQMVLWELFGASFSAYWVLGLFVKCVSYCLVYSMICRFAKPIFSFIATFFGVVIEAAYTVNVVYDYHGVFIMLVTLSAYGLLRLYESSSEKATFAISLLVGFAAGIMIMSKQSIGPFLFFVLLVALIVVARARRIKLAKPICCYIIGTVAAIAPGFIVMLVQGSLSDFVFCLSRAHEAKGFNSGFVPFEMISRMFDVRELLIAFVLLSWLLLVNSTKDNHGAAGGERKVVTRLLLCALAALVIWRYADPLLSLYCYAPAFKTTLVLLAPILASIALVLIILAIRRLSDGKDGVVYRLLPILAFLIIAFGFLIIVNNYLYPTRSKLYESNVPFSVLRSITNICFWFSVVYFIVASYYMARRRPIVGNWAAYVLMGVSLSLTLSGLFGSVPEELYMLPFVSLLAGLILASMNRFRLISALLVVAVLFAMFEVVVTQKQVSPYSWHGWTVESTVTAEGGYRNTDIPELQNFVFSCDDATAYESIVGVIESNTNEYDTVFQFCSIPLFNVITQRDIGTYAPMTYIDVCPDYVAEIDLEELKANPPKAIIWNEFGDDTWLFLDNYHRNSDSSGQEKIREFYKQYVQSNYSKEYEYRTISVWVRE